MGRGMDAALWEKLQGDTKDPWRSVKSRRSNDLGHQHEVMIEGACRLYNAKGVAFIQKTPEPFRVTKKHPDGRAEVRFTAHAEPDFKGELAGGRAICFEAKYTSTARIRQEVVTKVQAEALDRHAEMGAVAAVCVGIGDKAFFVPWKVFSQMKELFGHKYATAEDLKPWQVRNTGTIQFLDHIIGEVKVW